MEKLTVYYSVHNQGYGSAYPYLFESAELAEFDQNSIAYLGGSGWGESCTGSFDFQSDSPIICMDSITTKEDFLVETYLEPLIWEDELETYHKQNLADFQEQFYPNGLPKLVVKPMPKKDDSGELYLAVFDGDNEIGGGLYLQEDDLDGAKMQAKIDKALYGVEDEVEGDNTTVIELDVPNGIVDDSDEEGLTFSDDEQESLAAKLDALSDDEQESLAAKLDALLNGEKEEKEPVEPTITTLDELKESLGDIWNEVMGDDDEK